MAKKNALVLAVCMAAICVNMPATAEQYPSRPISIIIPYPPAGFADPLARIIADRMQQEEGWTFVIENRPGASGGIAANLLSRANPDGYTIGILSNAIMTTNPHVMKSTVDPITEFRPISGGSSAIAVIAVNDSVPAKNLKELIEYAKKNPGKLSYGTPGVGSPYHIGVEYIKKLSGIDIVHVPFQGGGPLLNAILGNHVPIGIASTSTFAGAVSSGKVSLVATGEAGPSDMAPSVAPISETFEAIEIPTWIAFFAPAGTPERIVKILNEKIVTILNEPATRDRLRKLGQIASPSSPEELQATVKKESDYWAKVVPLSGVTLQK